MKRNLYSFKKVNKIFRFWVDLCCKIWNNLNYEI